MLSKTDLEYVLLYRHIILLPTVLTRLAVVEAWPTATYAQMRSPFRAFEADEDLQSKAFEKYNIGVSWTTDVQTVMVVLCLSTLSR